MVARFIYGPSAGFEHMVEAEQVVGGLWAPPQMLLVRGVDGYYALVAVIDGELLYRWVVTRRADL